MDAQHPCHGLTRVQQLLGALSEELSIQAASGQLVSDMDEVRLSPNYSALTHPSHRFPASQDRETSWTCPFKDPLLNEHRPKDQQSPT